MKRLLAAAVTALALVLCTVTSASAATYNTAIAMDFGGPQTTFSNDAAWDFGDPDDCPGFYWHTQAEWRIASAPGASVEVRRLYITITSNHMTRMTKIKLYDGNGTVWFWDPPLGHAFDRGESTRKVVIPVAIQDVLWGSKRDVELNIDFSHAWNTDTLYSCRNLSFIYQLKPNF